jgi:hypothetical protein
VGPHRKGRFSSRIGIPDSSSKRTDPAALSAEERAANRKIVVGTLREQDEPEFTRRWDEFVKELC